MLRKPCRQGEGGGAPFRGSGMRSEGPRNQSRLLLVLCLQLLKHRSHRTGIVSGGVHVLDAQLVSFLFGAATELHKYSQQAKSRRVLIDHSRDASEKD